MKIVADENMPNVVQLFAPYGDITLVDGRRLTRQQLLDVDVLLVRSVTRVNEALLQGTAVKFVGTATIGIDHIEKHYLAGQGIGFASAPGCNANAVADYVISSLCYLYKAKQVLWLQRTIAIIGYGNVGREVYRRLHAAGCVLIVHDPFEQNKHQNVCFVSLEQAMSADIICFHAPLTFTGDHPSFHMVNASQLAHLKAGSSLISAGRGGVIDETALLERYHQLEGELNLVFDVWENEPKIRTELFQLVDIATPHIAGYSKQGRELGTWMIYQAFLAFFAQSFDKDSPHLISRGAIKSLSVLPTLSDYDKIAVCAACVYDVMRDDSYMRSAYRKESLVDGIFDRLRREYIERDEFRTCVVDSTDTILCALGFSASAN